MKKNNFSDKTWSFPLSFDEFEGTVKVCSDKDSVKQSLYVLISTCPGERLFDGEYGYDLSKVAFKRLDLTLEEGIKNDIKEAIRKFEPRVLVENIFLVDDLLKGTLNIKISYIIKSTGSKDSVSINYTWG